MKHPFALALAATLLAALLAGCGGAPQSAAPEPEQASAPVEEPTPEPTPAPTPEPTPTPTPEPEYTPGERTETGYTNAALGLQFTLPANMVMASDEEIDAMMAAGAEIMYEDPETGEQMLDYAQLTTVYEMVAVDVTNGSNVMIVCEKLPLEATTEEQYIEALRAQMAQTTVETDLGEPEPATLGGVAFTALHYTVASNGVETSQTMLVHKEGGRMYAIAISYQLPEQRDAILAAFSALPTEV